MIEGSKEARIRELQGKIVQVCVTCSHARVFGGIFQCKVSRRHCHSARVTKYLKEIDRLERGQD